MRGDYNKEPIGAELFPVLQSKGADGQTRIEAYPDAWWEYKQPGPAPILNKAGYLLVAMGQRMSTARLTAVASDTRYVGQGWMPASELTPTEAKAAAVFLNSTAGRLMIGRHPGKTLEFPFYNPAAWKEVCIPDLSETTTLGILLDCWENTRHEIVPRSAMAMYLSVVAGIKRCVMLWAGTSTRSQNSGSCSPASRVSAESRTDSGKHRMTRG